MKKKWSFEIAVKSASKTYKSDLQLPVFLAEFWKQINDPQMSLQNVSAAALHWIFPIRRAEALILSSENPAQCCRLIKLMMRYQVFHWYTYLDTASKLAEESVRSNTQKRLRIGKIDAIKLTDICLVMGLSCCMHYPAIGRWFGEKCIQYSITPQLFWSEQAVRESKVAAYLLQLFEKWIGYSSQPIRSLNIDIGIYQSIFDNWDDPVQLDLAVIELCKLHVQKNQDADLPNMDGIYCLQSELFAEYPVEIFFLQYVRKSLGLSVPNPDHPLIKTLYSDMVIEPEPFQYDEHIHGMYRRCLLLNPTLSIPWEPKVDSDSELTNNTTIPFLKSA